VTQVVGEAPVWPESLQDARQRFAECFLRYIHRSNKCGKNFIIVTHADSVAAASALLPCRGGRIKYVEPCGMLLAERAMQRHAVRGGPTTEPPSSEDQANSEPWAEAAELHATSSLLGGWTVQSYNLELDSQRGTSNLTTRMLAGMKKLAERSKLPQEQIRGLLATLSHAVFHETGTTEAELSPLTSPQPPRGQTRTTFHLFSGQLPPKSPQGSQLDELQSEDATAGESVSFSASGSQPLLPAAAVESKDSDSSSSAGRAAASWSIPTERIFERVASSPLWQRRQSSNPSLAGPSSPTV